MNETSYKSRNVANATEKGLHSVTYSEVKSYYTGTCYMSVTGTGHPIVLTGAFQVSYDRRD